MNTFDWILLIAVAAAFFFLFQYVKKQLAARTETDTTVVQREARLVDLYNHVEELMDVFETYIEEVRQDIERERASLTEMSRQAATLYMRALESPVHPIAPAPIAPAPTAPPPPPPLPLTEQRAAEDLDAAPGSARLSDRDREALGRFATKPQKVRFLMSRGLALEEVARALGIGKGEVRLIAELER